MPCRRPSSSKLRRPLMVGNSAGVSTIDPTRPMTWDSWARSSASSDPRSCFRADSLSPLGSGDGAPKARSASHWKLSRESAMSIGCMAPLNTTGFAKSMKGP